MRKTIRGEEGFRGKPHHVLIDDIDVQVHIPRKLCTHDVLDICI